LILPSQTTHNQTMELSREQQLAFDKYIEGNNVFITGPGGTGKSELIRKIYKHATNAEKKIHVCALTGCASVLLNCSAKTLHSWSGIGLGNGEIDGLLKKIRSNRYTKKMWCETEILIVDEVSMLSLKLFDLLNILGKRIRKTPTPFGGIQVIFSGDFYQLPPVGDRDDPDTSRFCFESEEWNNVFPDQIQLKHNFRQSEESYCEILKQVREGRIKRKSHELLLNYVGRECDPDRVITKLYPTKSQVESINSKRMNALTGEVSEFKMTRNIDAKRGFTDQEIEFELDFLSNNLICDKLVKLKIGANVMCVVNIKTDSGIELCNGSQGVVVGYCPFSHCPRVKYNNGSTMVMHPHAFVSEKIPSINVAQIPLILAWALTIHKSQGATLDAAEIDVGSGIFECGQTYVALSRVKSLEGLYLTSYDASKIKINKKVYEYYQSCSN